MESAEGIKDMSELRRDSIQDAYYTENYTIPVHNLKKQLVYRFS